MASNSLLVVFVLCSTVIVQITGQGCRPAHVDILRVTEYSSLEWSPPVNDSCEISHYVLEIRGTNTEIVREIAGTETSLRSLPYCRNYQFTIAAVSTDGISGDLRLLHANLPLPIGADLGIVLFSAARREDGTYLEWKIRDEWNTCVDQYRLSIYDDENDPPTSIYLRQNNVTLTSLTPCTTYTFGIRAIYVLEQEGPYTATKYSVPAARIDAPVLRHITLQRTSVDLTWELESYQRNRCTISSLTVDASPYFKVTYPINDQTNRSQIRIHLEGLESNTLYSLNVTATNIAGVSPPALIAVQTLES